MRLQIQRIFVQLIWSLVAVAAAWGTTEVLYRVYPPLRGHGHYTFFLAAIAIAAWRGGILCALFTVVMSSLVVAWLMPPANSFRINNPEDIVRLALFGGLGLLISYLHYTRHRAEESFKESERRLRFSLDSSGVACWDANVKNGTFWKSHNLPEVYGRTESDFANTYEGFFAYIHPEDREFFNLATVGGEGNQRDYEINHRIICGDGSSRRVKTRGRMYLSEEGRVERMVGAVYSINSKLASSGPLHPVLASETEIAAYIA
jgi:PAS domain-containing protein